MAEEINKVVEITGRETVKPCSWTPQHLRNLKLTVLDQLSPDFYIPLALFYPLVNSTINPQNHSAVASERSKRLRETLSKALVLFYPFAGRLRNNLFIECTDEGVEFSEARASCLMSDFLRKPNLEAVKKFVPTKEESTKASLVGCLLLAQVTIFDCGGIALGLSFSHKIFDACTIGTFLKSWAEIALHEKATTTPEFGKVINLFPPYMDMEIPVIQLVPDKYVTRRFTFGPEKIAELKIKAASIDGAKNPTRVEAVSGLIWKCAMEASRSNNPGFSKKSFWGHSVNMRTRIAPPLTSNVAGNLVGGFAALAEETEHGVIGVGGLVGKLRSGIEEVKEKYADSGYLRNISREFGKTMKLMNSSDQIDAYMCSSWCRFGLYDSDFGWEKPVWVCIASGVKNTVVLMDSRDGDGIEAWLSLSEEDMAVIESNEEFLAFASLDPSVV